MKDDILDEIFSMQRGLTDAIISQDIQMIHRKEYPICVLVSHS